MPLGRGPGFGAPVNREVGVAGRCLALDGTGGWKIGIEVHITFVLKRGETVSGAVRRVPGRRVSPGSSQNASLVLITRDWQLRLVLV